jgi:light-regulated signal transduction histidine kinase (bacteriophytochrome)
MAALDVCLHTKGGAAELDLEATGRAEHAADDDFFMLVKATVGRLQALGSVRTVFQQVTEEVRAITGLDRVMAYRFHADHHGEVIAKSKRDTLDVPLGQTRLVHQRRPEFGR